jgi:hypothetical protein
MRLPQFTLKTMLPALIAVLCATVSVLWPHPPEHGINVVIKNTGIEPVESLVLPVTGRSYPLGSIAPGHEKAAIVKPTSESHLEIELADTTGGTARLNAGGYFEPGYGGTITVSIKDGALADVKDKTTIY